MGGNTKVYGASLPRFRERDFAAVEHLEGTSPAWPFGYRDLESYYAEAERLFGVHGTDGMDPTEPWRSGPFPYPALPHEPYVAALADRLRARGVHPAPTAMAVDRRPGGRCIRCADLRRFPLPPPCQGGRRDMRRRSRRRDGATARCRPAPRSAASPLDCTGRRVRHLVATGPDGTVSITGGKFVLSAGAVNSAALLLASADDANPSGLSNSSGQVGRNFMMHNNAHIAAVDLNRHNDVRFAKTLAVNDWYLDGGDGYPLGSLQLIGKVQGIMMKSWATHIPLPVLDQLARRSVEWLVMAEDLPAPGNRVTVDGSGSIVTARAARGTRTHRLLRRRAKRLLRDCGYDFIATQPFDISMNSHQCGTVVAGI